MITVLDPIDIVFNKIKLALQYIANINLNFRILLFSSNVYVPTCLIGYYFRAVKLIITDDKFCAETAA